MAAPTEVSETAAPRLEGRSPGGGSPEHRPRRGERNCRPRGGDCSPGGDSPGKPLPRRWERPPPPGRKLFPSREPPSRGPLGGGPVPGGGRPGAASRARGASGPGLGPLAWPAALPGPGLRRRTRPSPGTASSRGPMSRPGLGGLGLTPCPNACPPQGGQPQGVPPQAPGAAPGWTPAPQEKKKLPLALKVFLWVASVAGGGGHSGLRRVPGVQRLHGHRAVPRGRPAGSCPMRVPPPTRTCPTRGRPPAPGGHAL